MLILELLGLWAIFISVMLAVVVTSLLSITAHKDWLSRQQVERRLRQSIDGAKLSG